MQITQAEFVAITSAIVTKNLTTKKLVATNYPTTAEFIAATSAIIVIILVVVGSAAVAVLLFMC